MADSAQTSPAMWAAASCAALLHQGRAVHATALFAFLPACGYALTHTSALAASAAVVALLALLAETYFAIRTGIDAHLFDRLTTDARDLPHAMGDLDRGLEISGLVRPGTQRQLGERITGAKRLMRNQIVAAVFVVLPSLAMLLRGVAA